MLALAKNSSMFLQALAQWYSKYGGYKNHHVKTTLSNIEQGKDYPEAADPEDHQVNSCVAAPALLARYRDSADWLKHVEAGMRMTQADNLAIQSGVTFVKILHKVAGGSSVYDASTAVLSELKGEQHDILNDVLQNKGASSL